MNNQYLETYQDFPILSDEKPSIGSAIFVNNQKYIVVKLLDRRVYHNAGDGDVEGFNPDLGEDQGWMRHKVLAEKASD